MLKQPKQDCTTKQGAIGAAIGAATVRAHLVRLGETELDSLLGALGHPHVKLLARANLGLESFLACLRRLQHGMFVADCACVWLVKQDPP